MENNKKLIITHGDFDGIACAVLIARLEEMDAEDVRIIFTQPFLVDKIVIPEDIKRIYVLDIAINNRDIVMTRNFIRSIYNKLVLWADHHKGWSSEYIDDYKFVIREGLTCADIIGTTDDVFVSDAIAADTRKGEMSPNGILIENAMKANMSDDSIRISAVKWLLGDDSQKPILEKSAEKYRDIEHETIHLANTYVTNGNVVIADARNSNHQYDLTQLLLAGQKIAKFAVVKTISPSLKEERLTIATQSGVDLVKLFNLPSGAPFRVTLDVNRFNEALEILNK